MRKLFFRLLGCCWLLGSMHASAVEVSQLDQSVVNVASRSDADREAAIREALSNVLVKNSGARSVLNNNMVAERLGQASSMVMQFGYTDDQGQLKLQALFEHDKIINLLRAAGEPVWGRQRPLTLIWLASDENNQPQIVADGVTNDERQLFADASSQRGIPVLFPLMDLDDLQAVNVNDVRGQFADTVARASARYQADYFAMASLTTVGDGIHYQISLYDKTNSEQAFMQPLISDQNTAVDKPAAIAAMMFTLSNYFVSRYAVADSGESQQTTVTFSAITQKQLVEIEAFLKQLTAVKSVTIDQLQGDKVSYRLQLFGSVAELKNLFSLESRMVAAPETASAGFDNSVSAGTYEWHSRQ
ncbi:DUF2066 domain-containing protein [Shewanella sp. A32]|uniref:DUF2066 domain-containing protein n=1 Tax=Shewanella sp. A32 TaxID=3031327 RepID=UPI0023B8ABF8|nr:DUF2066 domain-containing protein [Shewanella sp. A32]MDF0535767.1 DUF2066 domain-containing protein [Shewanella sp. A32]